MKKKPESHKFDSREKPRMENFLNMIIFTFHAGIFFSIKTVALEFFFQKVWFSQILKKFN